MEDSKASKIRDHILRKFQRAANIWKLKIEIKSSKDQKDKVKNFLENREKRRLKRKSMRERKT